MTPHLVWLTSLIFAVTYIALAIGKLPGLRTDRCGIAIIGAALMLCTGVLTLSQAISEDSIDYETLVLLFSMMIVVSTLRLSGFLSRATDLLLGRIHSPRSLLVAIIFLAGLLSAFLVNDVVCVALAPLVLELCQHLNYRPIPHVIGLATAANIGSTATITGNPQNIYIGAHSGIPYGTFAMHLLPIAVIGLVIDFFVIAWIYRKDLVATADYSDAQDTRPEDSSNSDSDYRFLEPKAVAATLVMIALFFTGVPIYLSALGVAAFVLASRMQPVDILREVDWSLLAMFTGLFIVVHAFQLHVVSHWPIEQWTTLTQHPITILSLASAILSNLVSNVPAVLLFEPLMKSISPSFQQTAWLALGMSSTLAGNFTILGSIANLIVVENAKRRGVEVSFWEYSKAGIPVTILTIAVGMAWLACTAP